MNRIQKACDEKNIPKECVDIDRLLDFLQGGVRKATKDGLW